MAGRLSKYFLNRSAIILIFIVVLSILSLMFLYYNNVENVTYESFPQIHSSDRIIIFSPHPDDESLANSGVIKEALKANATVLVVMMTNGDATPINITDYTVQNNITNFNGTIGDYRHLETINAMKKLGLNESNIIFLSYPDGALKYLFGSNWDYNNLYKGADNSGNNYDHSPYSFSYEKNAPYCGANVDKNIEQIIRDFKPTIVFYPDDGDEHPDHAATSAFVIYALIKTEYTGSTFTYLVHKGSWPSPLNYQPKYDLEAPRDVLDLDGTWYMLNLTDEDEASKEQAISSHATQISLMKNYLMAFVRVNEIFAKYPIIDVDKVSNTNFTSGLPSSSFEDLRYDSQTAMLLPSTDLAGAGLVYDDRNVYLLLKTSGDINTLLIYDYHLRIFNGTDFKRLDVTVQNGTAGYELKANNSISANGNIGVDVQKNIMVVKVPIQLFKDAKLIMMSADIKDVNKNKLDDMSWRVFKFPTDFLSELNKLL
ncbi:MAG TPA: PIG-L family deacetylase [Methanobacterium sp.]|nr:PIG-L family deacetylase [Methanobacterium sp.]